MLTPGAHRQALNAYNERWRLSPGAFLYGTALPASWRGLAACEIRKVIRSFHDVQMQ
jgi:hypothetical protein